MLISDKRTGKSKGYAFIYYTDIKSAVKAQKSCTSMRIDGRFVRVDFSLTKKPHNYN